MTTVSNSGSHCVHFYEPNVFPAEHVARFIQHGIVQQQSIVVIASERHAAQIETEVELLGISVKDFHSLGRWSLVSTEALEDALLSGVTIEALLEHVIGPTFQNALAKTPMAGLRVYGEFVDVLLRLRKPELCLKLERFGNQLASENRADVYCAYSADAFLDAGFAKHFTQVCLLHSLIHTNLKDRNDWRYRLAFGIALRDAGVRDRKR